MASNLYDTILLTGDSITDMSWMSGGLAQRLSEAYARRLDVINRGLGGYNSEWGLTVFKEIFSTKDKRTNIPTVRLLTIWWGANDATNPGDPQHVDISKYAENLHTIISLITSPTSPYYSPDTRIIVITPPPINPAQGPQFLSRNNVNTKAYAIQAANVAEEMNVPVVDAWNLFWNWGKGEETALSPLFTDGLHLTPEGYQLVFDELMAVIGKNFPELLPTSMGPVFPPWDQVDPNDLHASVTCNFIPKTT